MEPSLNPPRAVSRQAGAGEGYDPGFLPVAVPAPTAEDRVLTELTYTHFTVWLDLSRRLAAGTAVNIDGAALREVARVGVDWHLDPRVPATDQTGSELYARNDLDRGHLVRRRDPVWGEPQVAGQANADTFSYPNAAPMAADFNQSARLWLGLEDYVLDAADMVDARLSVLTGPVLADDDPTYRGVGVPRQFWKIAAWTTPDAAAAGARGGNGANGGVSGNGERLAAVGWVLDQSPQLEDIDVQAATARALAAGDVPPLGPYRTFAVPVADIAGLTGLDLGPLVAADRYEAPAAAAGLERTDDQPARWRELVDRNDVDLGRTRSA